MSTTGFHEESPRTKQEEKEAKHDDGKFDELRVSGAVTQPTHNGHMLCRGVLMNIPSLLQCLLERKFVSVANQQIRS